jgi:hypothetical protein
VLSSALFFPGRQIWKKLFFRTNLRKLTADIVLIMDRVFCFRFYFSQRKSKSELPTLFVICITLNRHTRAWSLFWSNIIRCDLNYNGKKLIDFQGRLYAITRQFHCIALKRTVFIFPPVVSWPLLPVMNI